MRAAVLVFLGVAAAPPSLLANSIVATWQMPEGLNDYASINLCGQAVIYWQPDYKWVVDIDVDNNLATGQPGNGLDVELAVSTTAQVPCSSFSVAWIDLLQSHLQAQVKTWDNNVHDFVYSSTLSIPNTASSPQNELTLQADLTGPLSGLSPQSRVLILAVAFYQDSGLQGIGSSFPDNWLTPLGNGVSFTQPPGSASCPNAACSAQVTAIIINLVASTVQLSDLIFRDGLEGGS